MKIYFNKLNEDAIIPQYAHEDDAGLDFYSFEDTYIGPGETVIVKTGLRCMFENKYVMIMTGKSGIDSKGIPAEVSRTTFIHDDDTDLSTVWIQERKEVRVKTGIIESTYRGELGVIMKNESDETIKIPKGIKIAQGVLVVKPKTKNDNVQALSDEEWDKIVSEEENNERGEGGFGSTGLD